MKHTKQKLILMYNKYNSNEKIDIIEVVGTIIAVINLIVAMIGLLIFHTHLVIAVVIFHTIGIGLVFRTIYRYYKYTNRYDTIEPIH